MPDIDDLLAAIRSRDSHALRRLYDQFGPQVYSLAFAVTHNRETAEEVTQDVFMKVWNLAADQYEAGTNFRAWLLRITRNAAIDRLRHERAGADVITVEDMERNPGSPGFVNDDARRVHAALNALSPEQRQAIELAYFRGMTQREIAAHTATPLGTIKTRIRDGMRKLRKALD